MKKIGDKVNAKYQGEMLYQCTVKAVAKLDKPVKFSDNVVGDQTFNPAIILLERNNDKKTMIWLPYWKSTPKTKGKERYGQFAPMYGENIFLPLLKNAINEKIFSKGFLVELRYEIQKALDND